jgi:uncharacterized membrane protein
MNRLSSEVIFTAEPNPITTGYNILYVAIIVLIVILAIVLFPLGGLEHLTGAAPPFTK